MGLLPLTQKSSQPQRVSVLGSTGSIGTQSLEVLAAFPERFQIHALAAGKNINKLAEQVLTFNPVAICIADNADIAKLKALVPNYKGDILSGEVGLNQLATDSAVDTLVVGLVGMIGLPPTVSALKAGKRVLTANKETFVAGGHLVAPYLNQIVPIDSEHAAIHQCIGSQATETIKKIYLTASGGPFRTWPLERFNEIRLSDALNHPNWVMGQKITVDSATLMNKGLEVIEAHWLFGVNYDQIQVVVHPQSMIHSGVAFTDGNILTQLGTPDMRIPIQYALLHPERQPTPFEESHLDLLQLSQLDFEPPDFKKFPCLRFAYEAGRQGSSATAILNAADEVAVALFLKEKIGFTDIPRLLEQVLTAYSTESSSTQPDLQEIQHLDAWARHQVEQFACLQI